MARVSGRIGVTRHSAKKKRKTPIYRSTKKNDSNGKKKKN